MPLRFQPQSAPGCPINLTVSVTSAQLKRLQVLYAQFERHSLSCPGASREARIAWASGLTGRTLASFSDLTLEEAKRLIDILQSAVGHKHPAKPRAQARRRAEKMGTEGRHDQKHDESTLVGPGELAMIWHDLTRLGWDGARLEAFLRSPRGPNKGSAVIRTLGDANRVHWALKHIKPTATQEQPAA